MSRTDALITKNATHFKDALVTTDYEALQPQLRGNPQEELGAQGVVVSNERSSGRTSGDGVKHRGFNFHEVLVPQVATNRLQHLAAASERNAGFGVGPQVGFAVAVAQIEVRNTGPLVTEVLASFGQHLPEANLDAQFAALGSYDFTFDADPVTEVQFGEGLKLVRHRREGEELNLTAGVTQSAKGQLALGP